MYYVFATRERELFSSSPPLWSFRVTQSLFYFIPGCYFATEDAVYLIFGKIFHFSLEEIILASNANIGGPTTAAAMAISKGWNKLIGPVLLIGTLGYVLGNYYGVLVGNLLR